MEKIENRPRQNLESASGQLGSAWESWLVTQDWDFDPQKPIKKHSLLPLKELALGMITGLNLVLSTTCIIGRDLPSAAGHLVLAGVAEGTRRISARRKLSS